ncbi:MAG: DUF4340 domain-containing protein, partial [Planctomycetes bacterium]|nr:DUF4340 domain-containing protein [Planctomycetota bacterium]
MNAWKTTSIYLIGAGLLAGAAFFLTWTPAQTEAYKDIGEEFYPGFTDPLAAKSIEVVSWDEAKAARVPFKVQYRDGRWRIPSHFDYPADAEDNLKKVATQYIGVKKDDVRSDLPADHEKFGVVDPLDESVSGNAGRGKRVTFRDLAGNMLADLIIGKAVEGKSGYFYVRLPGKPRVYASKIDAKVSAEFKDWVETDLLKLTSSDIQTLKFNNYS